MILIKTTLNFTILMIISLLILISISFYAYAQKDNTVKDIQFKNYENSRMFLNFSVPSNGKITFNENILGSFQISMYYPEIVDKDYRIAISMDNNPKNETLVEQFTKYIDEDSEQEIIEEEKTTLANFPAYKILWEENDEKVLKIVSLINGFRYEFTFETQIKDYKKYFPIAETMISSLKVSIPNDLKYTLPVFINKEKKFSIQYPFDTWTMKEKENRFEEYDVQFEFSDFIGLRSMNLVEKVAVVLIAVDDSFEINQNLLEKYLDTWLSDKSSSFENYMIIEPVSLNIYNINGSPAASALYSAYINGEKVITLVVSSLTEQNNPILINYSATPNEFDEILPIVEKMIDSISIPAVR